MFFIKLGLALEKLMTIGSRVLKQIDKLFCLHFTHTHPFCVYGMCILKHVWGGQRTPWVLVLAAFCLIWGMVSCSPLWTRPAGFINLCRLSCACLSSPLRSTGVQHPRSRWMLVIRAEVSFWLQSRHFVLSVQPALYLWAVRRPNLFGNK